MHAVFYGKHAGVKNPAYEETDAGIKKMNFKAYWDGACSADKILKFAPMGMDGFVLGTTLLFGKGKPYKETIREIRRYCDGMAAHDYSTLSGL